MPLLYKKCCSVRPWDPVLYFSSFACSCWTVAQNALLPPLPLLDVSLALSQACGQVFHQAPLARCLWLGGLRTQQCFLLLGRSHAESPGPRCCVTGLTAHHEIPGWWQCLRMLPQRLLYLHLDMKKRCGASIRPRLQWGLWS